MKPITDDIVVSLMQGMEIRENENWAKTQKRKRLSRTIATRIFGFAKRSRQNQTAANLTGKQIDNSVIAEPARRAAGCQN